MSRQQFQLQPFADEQAEMALALSGSLTYGDGHLLVCYRLMDPKGIVVISPPASAPTRHHHLWQSTCFELFLAERGCDRYWEVNLSPAGHWNLYRFEGYRQGMQEEHAVMTLPFQISAQPQIFQIEFDLELGLLRAKLGSLDIGVTAVLATQGGALSYWALTHCQAQADFHCRDSFTLTLASPSG
ncbi:hypothetical protein GS597_02705 [Synechococcales cyanobacterium C]|uniref:DOMON-like domain-containing protein n=1 Tax=Petrachloros mirabilis ULC683 TaxID=2781853 RepID=A0A8K2A6S1_9CYAN|nr:DOMON-like domain-containing protein [Petrachloros mirabilis]NCJ05440.1 hypothetical protein [Petrachloros mirabilis ULC683]